MKFVLSMLQIAYTSLMILFTGYTYSCLWNWFVVTTFHVPAVNIPTAIGLALFVTMFREINYRNAEIEDFQLKSNVALLLKPALVLLVAYTVKQFM